MQGKIQGPKRQGRRELKKVAQRQFCGTIQESDIEGLNWYDGCQRSQRRWHMKNTNC